MIPGSGRTGARKTWTLRHAMRKGPTMIVENKAAGTPPSPMSTTRDLDGKRLREACQEFESFLSQHLLNSMSESIMRAEEPDQARETFEGMFRETLAGELSHHSRGGMADLLYRQLSSLLEAGSAPSNGVAPGSGSGSVK